MAHSKILLLIWSKFYTSIHILLILISYLCKALLSSFSKTSSLPSLLYPNCLFPLSNCLIPKCPQIAPLPTYLVNSTIKNTSERQQKRKKNGHLSNWNQMPNFMQISYGVTVSDFYSRFLHYLSWPALRFSTHTGNFSTLKKIRHSLVCTVASEH